MKVDSLRFGHPPIIRWLANDAGVAIIEFALAAEIFQVNR